MNIHIIHIHQRWNHLLLKWTKCSKHLEAWQLPNFALNPLIVWNAYINNMVISSNTTVPKMLMKMTTYLYEPLMTLELIYIISHKTGWRKLANHQQLSLIIS